MKEDKAKQPTNENKKQNGEVSRRDFLVGAGTVVIGGAIGAGVLTGCGGEEKTVTTTVEKTKTVTTTLGEGATATVTSTTTVGGDGATVTETVTSTVTNGESSEPAFEDEKTFITLPGSNQNTACAIDVKHNKIVRVRALHFDEQYSADELAASKWKYTGKNRKTGEEMTFEARDQSDPSYLQYGFKKRIYSPNRILYPLKRVDWEPGGDPAKVNAQNRGKSKFKRVSWDEAASMIASEIKRVQDTYGPFAVLDKSDSCHREIKTVHGGACSCVVSGLLYQIGSTLSIRNADSWEGWYYGTKHVWGNGTRGAMPNENNLVLDHTNNVDMIIYAGCDWDTTACCSGMFPSRVARWYRKLGIKQVYIAPDMNFQNQSNPDKWIPVIPGRDDAYLLAIIYTWIQNDTYDKDYVDTHTVGFDYVKAYAMGDEDGIPKTPAWAAARCGVKEWTIKALAKQWALRPTSLDHHLGGAMIRGPYTHECARLWAVCLGMQGLGKPGINQNCTFAGPKAPATLSLTVGAAGAGSRYSGLGAQVSYPMPEKTKQIIARPVFDGAILDGHCETWGNTALSATPEDQFIKYVYPIDESEGGTRVHLIWQDHACHSACWNDSNKYIQAIRDASIECNIIQQQWLENDCIFADILLPINTSIEEIDLNNTQSGRNAVIYYDHPIQPVGESKTDYEAVCLVAEKLQAYGGRYEGIVDIYTGGKTIDEWIQYGYDSSPASAYISFEDLKEKGYYMAPLADKWEEAASGMIKFYEDPAKNPINLPSGLLEFYSERIAENFPDDRERPPYPKYVCGGPGWTHDESLDVENGAEKCKTYPLMMQSQHVRWRVHGQYDDIPWLREIPTCKVKGYDGYMYEACWIHPTDAAARDIKNGDIIKVFNERGIELAGAYITEKIIPGTVHMDHGAHLDMINCKVEDYEDRANKWVNRGGTGNNISPYPGLSQNAPGMCVSSYLVDISKVTGDEMQGWRENYPEAFKRDYDPRYGLLSSAWIEGGE